ncbi:MAG: hypothetical protein H6767_08240 [Candidatus Peribacteria bacterium]|nr:MAG: hypothetical protein H6767_08240 [Candidatus Peribacteria bacterium]
MISAVFRGILVLIILNIYIPELMWAVFVATMIIFIINYIIRRYIDPYTKKEQELWEYDGRIKARMIMENLLIRVFRKQSYELRKSQDNVDQLPEPIVKIVSANYIFYALLEGAIRLLEVGVYFYL